MASINNIKRLVREDFSEEDQELIDKLANSLNPFMQQVFDAFNSSIDMSNLDQQIITIPNLEVNSSQIPKKKTQFSYALQGQLEGVMVISAINTTSNSAYVTTAPFATIQVNVQGLAEIKHISGLTPNNKYTIKLLLITN